MLNKSLILSNFYKYPRLSNQAITVVFSLVMGSALLFSFVTDEKNHAVAEKRVVFAGALCP